MNLLTQLKLKNFKCFRYEETFDLAQSTYLIGINNAGKTAVLQGIRCFFDDTQFRDSTFLNRTEFIGKQAGYNKAEITATFDFEALTTKKRKSDLIKAYGKRVTVTKIISYTPESGQISIVWSLNENKKTPNLFEDKSKNRSELPEDLEWLFKSVKVTYIHPQEGNYLLENVQKRLRQRLLDSWGKGPTLAHSIKELEAKWNDMRTIAKKSLSQSLTESVHSFWPDSEVTVDLPKRIHEIINIADITFQADKNFPEIELTAQGTGAQSTILYIAHYLLDSDRSLNRGEYHPIWLMEEPESFLHADLLAKFSKQLNSENWLQNIQMITSSHSPILLASSRAVANLARWTILDNYRVRESQLVEEVSEDLVTQLGILMGDNNFSAYFTVSGSQTLIFIEDARELTVETFRNSGIEITKGLKGVSDIARHLDILRATPELLSSSAYFIVDSDKGLKELETQHLLTTIESKESGFKKFRCGDTGNIFVICLPEGKIVEDLFSEYNDHLSSCINKIWSNDYKVLSHVPSHLSRVVDAARKHPVLNRDDQVALIKNNQDVKDLFWSEVKRNKYVISTGNRNALLKLIANK